MPPDTIVIPVETPTSPEAAASMRSSPRHPRGGRPLSPGRRTDDLRTPIMTRSGTACNAIEARFPGRLSKEASVAGRRARRPKFAKVRHRVPMLSLDNAFADGEVTEFIAACPALPAAMTGRSPHRRSRRSTASRLSLRYEDGRLVTAATRGDGFEGEDVTANAPHDRRHSRCAADRRAAEIVEIRGEVLHGACRFRGAERGVAAAEGSGCSPIRATSPPARSASSTPKHHRRAAACASSPMPGAR